MANIGMDISVEELRRQFRDAVEKLAEMRADLDQATQEVERLRALLEGQEDRNGDLEIEIERLRRELKETRNATEPFNATSRKLCYEENEKLRKELEEVQAALDYQRDAVQAYAESENKLREQLEEARALGRELDAGAHVYSKHAHEDAKRAFTERGKYRAALEAAAKSLETLTKAGFGSSSLESIMDARQYADSRAKVARQALTPQEDSSREPPKSVTAETVEALKKIQRRRAAMRRIAVGECLDEQEVCEECGGSGYLEVEVWGGKEYGPPCPMTSACADCQPQTPGDVVMNPPLDPVKMLQRTTPLSTQGAGAQPTEGDVIMGEGEGGKECDPKCVFYTRYGCDCKDFQCPDGYHACPACEGRGKVSVEPPLPEPTYEVECRICEGNGYVKDGCKPQPTEDKDCACGGKIVPWRDNDLNQIGERCKKCHTKWRGGRQPPKPKEGD